MSLSGDNLTIAQTTQDKDIIFTVNDGGVTNRRHWRITGSSRTTDHLRVGI